MSSEEDDYMSDSFLLKCADTRPGLAPKHRLKEYDREKKQMESDKRNKTIPIKQLEIQQRETGLNTTISQNSKGFALLQKMGYKPGTGIGKSGEGRVDPVGFEVKTGRSGLGKDSDMKRKSSEMNSMRAAMLAKRKKIHEKQAQSFQDRMKDKFSDKLLEKDLRDAQKACLQLDQQAGLDDPPEPFYWPANSLPVAPINKSDEDSPDVSSSRHHPTSEYNKHPYEESDDDDLEHGDDECVDSEEEEPPYYLDFSVAERTEIITRYLRNVYRYCIWCGTSFEDEKEMATVCPGNSSDLHD